MPEGCRERIYSEDYLDFLVEYAEDRLVLQDLDLDFCYKVASSHFAVLYEEGKAYTINSFSGVKVIPHCYGLLSSDQVLESAGIAKVRRQVGLNLYGQGVLVGFIDTGERVILLSWNGSREVVIGYGKDF
ncbi:MAG TPA: hypothetical protein DDY31_03530 [Lachnospiraceae bacterium]|nr:hypothetical protein [Lachnospiraceae bacterium]